MKHLKLKENERFFTKIKKIAPPHANTPAFCHHHLCNFNMVEHGTQQ